MPQGEEPGRGWGGEYQFSFVPMAGPKTEMQPSGLGSPEADKGGRLS